MLWRWGATPDLYGYGHIIGDSGDWAAWLLMATLAVTPIRLAFRRNPIAKWLVRRRRERRVGESRPLVSAGSLGGAAARS